MSDKVTKPPKAAKAPKPSASTALAKTGQEKPRQSRSSKAGLVLSVTRVHRFLQEGNYALHIGDEAAIYLIAVMEYLASEVLELARNAALEYKRKRISPRHIQMAIRKDDELARFLKHVYIFIKPSIAPDRMPGKKKGKGKHAEEVVESSDVMCRCAESGTESEWGVSEESTAEDSS